MKQKGLMNATWDIPHIPQAYFDEMVLEDAVVVMHTEWIKFFSNEDREFRRLLGAQQLEHAAYIIRARIRRLLEEKKLSISCATADEVNLVQNILDLDRSALMSFYIDNYFKIQLLFFMIDGLPGSFTRLNLALRRIDVFTPPLLHDRKHYIRLLSARDIRAMQKRSIYERDSFSFLEENAWMKATSGKILSNCSLTALALGYPMSPAIDEPLSPAIRCYLAHYVYYRKRNGRIYARRTESIRKFLMDAFDENHFANTTQISAPSSDIIPQTTTAYCDSSISRLEWGIDGKRKHSGIYREWHDFRFGFLTYSTGTMTRLVVIQSLNHLVRVLALIILRIREGASYSTAFRCLTGRKLIDVLRSYGVKSIVHLANIRSEVLRIHDGLAVRVDGRHSEFSERCFFSYTTEQLTAQYRALQERERAKAVREEMLAKRVVEEVVVKEAEEPNEELKPIEAPAVAEESQITYKDSRSRIAEDVAPGDVAINEKNEEVYKSEDEDVAALIVDQVLKQIELERINDTAVPVVVNALQMNDETVDKSVVPEKVTIEHTVEEERVIDDVALVVAELLEDVDVKIEETDRSDIADDSATVAADVHKQVNEEGIDAASPEEDDAPDLDEERVVQEDEEESIEDVIAPVENEEPLNEEDERNEDDIIASLDADVLQIAVVYRVELANVAEVALLREYDSMIPSHWCISKWSRLSRTMNSSFLMVYSLPNVSICNEITTLKVSVPSLPILLCTLLQSARRTLEGAHLLIQCQLSNDFFITSTSLSTEITSIQEEGDEAEEGGSQSKAIPLRASTRIRSFDNSDNHLWNSGSRVSQTAHILHNPLPLVHYLGPNIHDFDEIRGTDERLAIMTFLYDLDVFYIRPLSHQSYYEAFAEELLRTHTVIAEEQKSLKEKEMLIMKNQWAIGDFACYVHLEKKKVLKWYEIPKTDKPLMWYKFLEIQNEVKKEDKAYRVRILSVRYGIEGMEYDIYSLDCGFIARGIPYENLVKIDSEYLRFNKEGSIWMPAPLCTPCTRRLDHRISFLHECHFTLPPAIFPREIDTEVAMTDLEDDSPLGLSLVDIRRRNIIL
ncbi:hypothetical protein PRIPAC_97969 [Pristionchus pacificus]|uniref:Uncharacterized protein n=1 Tax=Pristionchus pacificus TaxID=54126 RepID=A0A2A6CU31_PRIPA|nr:hypothetical protein PRIPAC_97969 [Pristionchus pacificus]|eukprot:PDM81596.1 hypothetical protein PRIPAC_30577 [Pristionchus pacificus]